MSRKIELAGKKFGAWNVVSYFGCNELGQPSWNCKCDCGTKRVVVGQTLRDGKSVSCGCTKGSAIAKAKTKHGYSRTKPREYKAWAAMRARCMAGPEQREWKWYGKNGITVCDRWNNFANFLADMGECPPKFSLDRINPYGNYEPKNCRWASAKTQANNRVPYRYRDLYAAALEAVCMVV